MLKIIFRKLFTSVKNDSSPSGKTERQCKWIHTYTKHFHFSFMLPSVPAQKSTLPQLVLFQNRFFVTVHLYWYFIMLIIVLILSSAKMISVNIFKRFKWCFFSEKWHSWFRPGRNHLCFCFGFIQTSDYSWFQKYEAYFYHRKKDKCTYPKTLWKGNDYRTSYNHWISAEISPRMKHKK